MPAQGAPPPSGGRGAHRVEVANEELENLGADVFDPDLALARLAKPCVAQWRHWRECWYMRAACECLTGAEQCAEVVTDGGEDHPVRGHALVLHELGARVDGAGRGVTGRPQWRGGVRTNSTSAKSGESAKCASALSVPVERLAVSGCGVRHLIRGEGSITRE